MELVDFYLDRVVSETDIRKTIAHVLGIQEIQVQVVDDAEELNQAYEIRLKRTIYGGQFPLRIEPWYGKASSLDMDAVLQKTCELLEARCLAPDNSQNPYAYILYCPGQSPQKKFVDVKALDERGELMVTE